MRQDTADAGNTGRNEFIPPPPNHTTKIPLGPEPKLVAVDRTSIVLERRIGTKPGKMADHTKPQCSTTT